MNQIASVNELQSELDGISKRRRSLESDVLYLDQKINIVNQNLEKNENKKKMMSLIEFFETEKQRIQEHKLKKVNEKTNELKNKIINIKSRQSEVYTSRKYQSYPPYLSHIKNEGIQSANLPPNQLKDGLSTHLPACMPMNVSRECTAVRDFFLKMQYKKEEDKVLKKYSNTNNDDYFNGKCDLLNNISNTRDSKVLNYFTYDKTIDSRENVNVSTTSLHQKQYCIRCSAEINKINNQQTKFHMNPDKSGHINQDSEAYVYHKKSYSKCIDEDEETFPVITQVSSKSSSPLQQPIDVISTSILATCESYAYCECCNNNLTKICIPTPSPSIVQIACKSHENCTKCTTALRSSQKESSSLTKPDLDENSFSKDDSVKSSKEMLCEEIQKAMKYQNQVIFDTKEQISKLSTLKESDDKLLQLRNMPQAENMKLEEIKNLVHIEERSQNY